MTHRAILYTLYRLAWTVKVRGC